MSYQKRYRPNHSGQFKGVRQGTHSQFKRKSSGSKGQGAYIHPSKFVKRASVIYAAAQYEPKHQFTDFPFSEKLQANVARRDYKVPTAIQDQTIPLILEGRDIIGLANTGTGKTAAFLLPLIDRLLKNRNPFSAVVLAPTRELAQQIDDQFRSFSQDLGLYSTLLVGGSNIDRQMTGLRRRPHLLIATPGRMMDLINRKKVPLQDVEVFVLDEADRMLDMGFINDIRKITQLMPESKQTLFFSATMTPKIRQLTEDFLNNPEMISVLTADTSERVDQDIIEVNSKEDKMTKLVNLLSGSEFDKVLLFGKTKHGVQRLSDQLRRQDINSVAIHGNKSQSQRQSALKTFKNGGARVMVATDVAARGLDIPNVSHVINFDQPATYEDYIHRIGRTGRGDATGIALTFVEK